MAAGRAPDTAARFGAAPLAHVDSSWKAAWGPTISAREVRFLIEDNIRLAPGIYRTILAAAAAAPDITLRAGDANAPADNADEALIERFLHSPKPALVQKIGLAYHANTLRRLLGDANGGEMLRVLDKDAIRYGIAYADAAPPAVHVAPAEINARLEADGFGALLRWIDRFPRDIALRLRVCLPRHPLVAAGEVAPDAAVTIVGMVLREENAT